MLVTPIFEYLLSAYGTCLTTALSTVVATVKGHPDWARPDAVMPCVVLLWSDDIPLTPEPRRGDLARIGQRHARTASLLQGSLIARDEAELLLMRDAFVAWHEEHDSFAVAAQRVDCQLRVLKRHVPESTSSLEWNAADFLVQVA